MSIIDLICGVIILLIIIGIIVIAVRFLFPGPEKNYPPQQYHQPHKYTDREYPARSYPPSQYTQRQYPPPAQPPVSDQRTQEKAQITYCKGCGKQIPQDANLCPYCGIRVAP